MARGGRTPRTVAGRKNLVGERVKERRKELKMTQDALNGRLAFLTGSAWNPKTQEILHLERGTRLVTDIEVLVLAKALKTSTQWLLTGKETELTEAELAALISASPDAEAKDDAEQSQTIARREKQ